MVFFRNHNDFSVTRVFFVKEEQLVIKGKRSRAYTKAAPVSCAVEFIFAPKMVRDH